MRKYLLTLFFLAFGFTTLLAQPSGGPYGPVRQMYTVPSGAGKVYYVAVDGKADQSGESLDKPTSIGAAIERVRTGDAIILRGGTYRVGGLLLNQGVTIQPYKDEKPVFKGTEVAARWENLGNGLWTTTWTRLFPEKPQSWWRRNREGKKTPQHKFNNDMVFVDGKFLQSKGWEGEVDEHSFFIDYETGTVYIGVDPTNRLVEITAYDVAILRTTKDVHGKKSDKKGYTLRGLTFTQYAYRALEIEGTEPEGISPESRHGKEVVGTTIEHCEISFCSRVAGYFRGDQMTFRNCKISDTSTEGLYIIASNDVLLERNILQRNNIENITGYYPAAVKIFNQSYRVTCNDNLVREQPNSNGIWYDVGNVDGVFTNNWIEGVGSIKKDPITNQAWPSDNGFFFEISKNVVCAGNVFVNCDHGMLILNASNAHIYNNTFINSQAVIARNGRSAQGDHFGWHPSTGPDVDERVGHIFVNNLITGDENFERPLFFTWQPADLCERLNEPMLKQMDNNVYVRGREKSKYPMILWSPGATQNCQVAFETIDQLKKQYPMFSTNSRTFLNYDGPLFKGREVGNFETVVSFPAAKAGMSIPAQVSKLLPGKGGFYIGAYVPIP